jgi:hypothetical protein
MTKATYCKNGHARAFDNLSKDGHRKECRAKYFAKRYVDNRIEVLAQCRE